MCYKQFLLFSQCFLPYMALIFHFKCTLKCRLQFVSIWTSLNCCRLAMGYRQVEKNVEKEENADNQHFYLFPQCFQNVSF